jgi:hypothetical protein
MIEICRSNQGDVDLSGTPGELQAIADAIQKLVGSDSESIIFGAETNYDPAPYDFNVPSLRIRKGIGPTKVSLTGEELLIEGSLENLIKFTSYLSFPSDAQPSNHTYYEYWVGNEWISPDSIPLIIGVRQQREKDVVDTDEQALPS